MRRHWYANLPTILCLKRSFRSSNVNSEPMKSPPPSLIFILSLHLFPLNASENPHPTVLAAGIAPHATLDIGDRLELFVDDYLIDNLRGKAELRLHHPEAKEIVMVYNEPWEGSGTNFHTIFKDDKTYRMYYKAWQHSIVSRTPTHPQSTCYAESNNGIQWTRPQLGLHEFRGSKVNNIVFAVDEMGKRGNVATVFRDDNPDAAADARYKAIRQSKLNEQDDDPRLAKRGLYAFKSPDGIQWKLMTDAPVITDGAFDSQNLAFWDSVREEYRCYWRYFTEETDDWRNRGVRAIRTATSKDFIHWSEPSELQYVDSPLEQLYTNVIKPYHRAPHVFVGFPMRYIDRGWSESMRALPERDDREYRAAFSRRIGTAVTETLLMASRDGVLFKRWNEAFLRPGVEREGTWNYGHQGVGWSIVETKSELEGAPDELSLYAVERYMTGTSSVLRRYILRIDGFVSVHAPMKGGELITKPIIFDGNDLVLNFSSSAAGDIQVEVQDEGGRPIPGYRLDECPPVFGDSLERRVTWMRPQENGNRNVSSLKGRTVRLRFVLKDADLYSLQFK